MGKFSEAGDLQRFSHTIISRVYREQQGKEKSEEEEKSEIRGNSSSYLEADGLQQKTKLGTSLVS